MNKKSQPRATGRWLLGDKEVERLNNMPSVRVVQVVYKEADPKPWCLGASYKGRPYYYCQAFDVRWAGLEAEYYYAETALPVTTPPMTVVWTDHMDEKERLDLEEAVGQCDYDELAIDDWLP